MKQQLIRIVRDLRLLPLAERIRLYLSVVQNHNSNRAFAKSKPGFSFPPYDLAYDAYGNINYADYYNNERKAAACIYAILGKDWSGKQIKICEWGCGPGRVVRHFPSIDPIDPSKHLEVYGVDYNKKTIRWCKDNIGGVEFLTNKLSPPLPFESNYLDCMYSISVYTHLSEEMHFAWLPENLRVVRSGGLIIDDNSR